MKFGLLRRIGDSSDAGGAGLSIGINWYLTPAEPHKTDGRYIEYLDPANPQHDSLEACDPDLMRCLDQVVKNTRSVTALEASGALPAGCTTHRELLDPIRGAAGRRAWHPRALDALASVDLVFADPDNGIRTEAPRSGLHKFALVDELADYANRGQSLIVYHHQDRTRGSKAESQARGRLAELADGVRQAPVGAVITHRWSCRFFLVTARDANHGERLGASLRAYAARWAPHADVVCAGTG